MKKIILTLAVAALAATSVFAQGSVGAGYLNSTSTTKVGDNTSKSDALNGFYAGADYSVSLVGNLKVTPGIYFSMLTGSGSSSLGSLVSATGTTTEMYLNVPVNFSYSLPLGSALSAFVYAGPTANIGCLASYKIDVNSVVGSGSSETDLYGDDSNYGRFDIMVGGGAGLDILKMVRVSVGYNYGLLDRNTSDNATLHRSELHAGVSYLF